MIFVYDITCRHGIWCLMPCRIRRQASYSLVKFDPSAEWSRKSCLSRSTCKWRLADKHFKEIVFILGFWEDTMPLKESPTMYLHFLHWCLWFWSLLPLNLVGNCPTPPWTNDLRCGVFRFKFLEGRIGFAVTHPGVLIFIVSDWSTLLSSDWV